MRELDEKEQLILLEYNLEDYKNNPELMKSLKSQTGGSNAQSYYNWLRSDKEYYYIASLLSGNNSVNSIKDLHNNFDKSINKIDSYKDELVQLKKELKSSRLDKSDDPWKDELDKKNTKVKIDLETELRLTEGYVETANKFLTLNQCRKRKIDLDLCKAYIANQSKEEVKEPKEKFIETEISPIQKEEGRLLPAQKWVLYFLIIQGDENGKFAKLSKAILETKPKFGASLKIKYEGGEECYKGDYGFLKNSNVSFFNLFNKENTSSVHLDIAYKSASDQIMLGIINITDENLITSHRVVVYNNREDDFTPGVLSYRDQCEEFDKVDILEIKNLLSLRKNNYIHVPWLSKKIITNINMLKTWQGKYSTFNNKENRFLEHSKPTLFIACPQSGDENINKSVKDNPLCI